MINKFDKILDRIGCKCYGCTSMSYREHTDYPFTENRLP